MESNKEKTIQVIEIGDIQWFTIDVALSKIRNYDIAKKNVLLEVDAYLQESILNDDLLD